MVKLLHVISSIPPIAAAQRLWGWHARSSRLHRCQASQATAVKDVAVAPALPRQRDGEASGPAAPGPAPEQVQELPPPLSDHPDAAPPRRMGRSRYAKPDLKEPFVLSDAHKAWFAGRGISAEVLEKNRVCSHSENCVAFPYTRRGEVINAKFRVVTEKKFWQTPDAEKIVFGYDDAFKYGQTELIIVEGEVDKLSFNEAGIWNVISVPDGAPKPPKQVVKNSSSAGQVDGVSKHDAARDDAKKFSFLEQCSDLFHSVSKVVLATDNDAPGDYLAEELARRLGIERCWRVQWPKRTDRLVGSSQSLKDANELLLDKGPEGGVDGLRQLVSRALPYPVPGLHRVMEYREEVITYYNQRIGADLGVSTGWKNLDRFYKVIPGELTIVTGVPNSGKSEWIDALLVNLAKENGWSFALCSMEKSPRDHARQLLEKYHDKPFFSTVRTDPTTGNQEVLPAMSMENVLSGLDFLHDHFHVIKYEEEESPTIDWVVDTARVAVMKYGIRGLVIDPYNELDHARPSFQNETEYVSQMLSKVKQFAQYFGVHVWFVAHPRQLQNWHGQPPTLYDISGSANFVNKADNGIVVHRVWDINKAQLHQAGKGAKSNYPAKKKNISAGPPELKPNEVKVLVCKVRNKAAGTIGNAVLTYERSTGRYSDKTDEEPEDR